MVTALAGAKFKLWKTADSSSQTLGHIQSNAGDPSEKWVQLSTEHTFTEPSLIEISCKSIQPL